jgi:PAS domain-containing protein
MILGVKQKFPGNLTKYIERPQSWGTFLSVLTGLFSALVLLGWSFDIERFKRPISGMASMNPVTSICFILLAFSLLILTRRGNFKQHQLVSDTFSGIVLVVGLIKLFDVYFETDTHIDAWLYNNQIDTGIIDQAAGNRMAPNTAIEFIFSSIALLLWNTKTIKKQKPEQYIAVLIGIVAVFSVLGYLYKVPGFYGVLSFTPMAIYTAVCFLMLALAILFAQPQKGLMAELFGTNAGASMARKFIPFAILVPLALGFIRVNISSKIFLPIEIGVGLLIFGNILISLKLIWSYARELNIKDVLRKKGEELLKEKLKEISDYKYALDESSITVITNRKGVITHVNNNFCKIAKYTAKELIGQNQQILNSRHHPKEFIKELWMTIANGKYGRVN